MMRALYSGVAGLKTHQTKMDVIGNNIANVNTTSYKAASVNFSELMYQTTSKASGPNATTGRAGVNARQIGLGVQSAAISNKITQAGATQTTGNPFDIKINGEAFFVVSDGSANHFTRDGSFYVDPAGNLAMTSNGYNVMGWGVDQESQTIKKDTVQALRIMSAANMTYPPEATTEAYVEGILDKHEPDAATTSGKTLTLGFYDALGYTYTAKFAIHETTEKGQYAVELADILDSDGKSLVETYNVNSISDIANFGSSTSNKLVITKDKPEAGYTMKAPVAPSTNYTFTKEVTDLEEMVKNYDAEKVANTKYTVTGVTAPTVSTEGAASLDKEVLAEAGEKGIHYLAGGLTADQITAATASGITDLPAAGVPFYFSGSVNADGTINAPGTVLTEITAANQAETEKWITALGDVGKGIDAAKVTSITHLDNGGVEIKFTQDFTLAEGVTHDATTDKFNKEVTPQEAYGCNEPGITYEFEISPDGSAIVTSNTNIKGFNLIFNVDSGKFTSIGGANSQVIDFNASATTKNGTTVSLNSFSDINVDFSNVTWFNNGGSSTITATAGTEDKGLGAGRKLGQMSGVAIQNNGEIYASYDNGMRRLLGQIAVAKFANAAGLEKIGENLYDATMNSGEFDGVGVDITADGDGSMATGALEMSNVDLSAEFTEMITTQRGFQANSRIITVSDTLLEELINLKR